MKYTLKQEGESAKANREETQALKSGLALGPYTGGAIASQEQLVAGLKARLKAERLLKEFHDACKAFVDENGAVLDEETGKRWGAAEYVGEKKLTASLADIELLLTDCAVPQASRARVLAALERRGIGAQTTTRRYAWTK